MKRTSLIGGRLCLAWVLLLGVCVLPGLPTAIAQGHGGSAEPAAQAGQVAHADSSAASPPADRYAGWEMGRRVNFGIKLCLIGMLVVMVVLALIASFTTVLARMDQGPPPGGVGAAPSATHPTPARGEPSLDPATVAVITAAVTVAAGGRPIRVRGIKESVSR